MLASGKAIRWEDKIRADYTMPPLMVEKCKTSHFSSHLQPQQHAQPSQHSQEAPGYHIRKIMHPHRDARQSH